MKFYLNNFDIYVQSGGGWLAIQFEPAIKEKTNKTDKFHDKFNAEKTNLLMPRSTITCALWVCGSLNKDRKYSTKCDAMRWNTSYTKIISFEKTSRCLDASMFRKYFPVEIALFYRLSVIIHCVLARASDCTFLRAQFRFNVIIVHFAHKSYWSRCTAKRKYARWQ